MKELGSEVARQPQGEVVQQSRSFSSSQPNPNPYHDRTGNLLFDVTQGPRKVEEKRPVPRKSKHVLFMKKL